MRLVGRLAGSRDGQALFSGSLRNVCALADLKLNRLLDTIDEYAVRQRPRRRGGAVPALRPHRRSRRRRRSHLDLAAGGISTVIWATGLRPDYSWLDVPVLDRKGRIRHDGGVVESPGMYLMGIPFLRRRKSSLIDGAADDARDLSDHLDRLPRPVGMPVG